MLLFLDPKTTIEDGERLIFKLLTITMNVIGYIHGPGDYQL